uniref:lanthionine synthetase LanC family protein n=1 Tax=Parabacteroides distasonis TaxID=823 RepID=UPI004026F0F9
MKKLFTIHKGELKDLLRYGALKAEVLENPGLYNGRLGMAILFYEYSRYCDDPLYEQFADEIMDSILELPDVLPLNFSEGISGIGWGMVYLLRKGFIEGDMDDILSDIDQKLNKSDLKESDKGYSTYLNMREGKANYESEILKNIWESCLYHSFLNNSKV